MDKKWHQRIKSILTEGLQIPADVMMDLPRVTMIGTLHIYIENHKGLLSFTDKEIRVLLQQGQMLIKGSDFVMKAILPEELLVEGKIEQVLYIDQ
ncbi:sporulation protein YqfC [Aeribacillus sp. FSL M8-0254]|uniref:sporulation protein YqfC n=1 Tax=Aeribacillus sp. FSL M8-0254 TaxID=2954577 RepID=UPI0030F94BFA